MSLLTTASLVVTPNANKTSKLYSVIPSNGNGDFTVTRATTATRTNSAGLIESTTANMLRRDYSLGSCPNLLLEPQRTNLALYSNQLTNAYWGKIASTITGNAVISPAGILDGNLMVETSANSRHMFFKAITTLTVGTTYSTTIIAKAKERNLITISVKDATNYNWYSVTFNLTNGSFVTSQTNGTPTNIDYKVKALSDGWYALTVVRGCTNATLNVEIGISNSTSPTYTEGIPTYVGDGTSGLYLYSAQLEAGAYATSYIPTTTASVTRNADSISLGNVYTNGLISASGGTWFLEVRNNLVYTRDSASSGIYLDTNNTSFTSGFNIRTEPTNRRLVISKWSPGSVLYTTTADIAKIAIKWNGTTADVFVNGTKVVTSTAFTTTAMQFLGARAEDCPKNINQMALWATPLTDTQLTQLTTL